MKAKMKFKLNIVVMLPQQEGGKRREVIYHKFERSTISEGIDAGKAIVEREKKDVEAGEGEIASAKLHLVQLVWRFTPE